MTTIVSAFISNANSYRSENKYIELAKHLLSIDHSKIIFLEQKIIDRLDTYKNTIFIPFIREDLYFFSCIHTDITIPRANQEKDTLEYLLIQINKTEWIKKAIELNPYNTSQFIWIDFGIHHLFHESLLFPTLLQNAVDKTYKKVRIAGIWPISSTIENVSFNIESSAFNTPLWYFAGGVFGGHKDNLLIFANKVREKTQECITLGYLTWEVNIWYAICVEHRDLFDIYMGSHDKTILENY